MQKPTKISGFPELLPEQQQKFQQLTNKLSDIFISFGALPIETPAVEKIDYLIQKGATDKEIYALSRVLSEADTKKELGLRFDLTVPLARYVAQHFQDLSFPFRRYQIQPVWRGERAQKGRYRQFYQADYDIIGNQKLSNYYDLEILLLVIEIFQKLNLGEFVINFSHRKILTAVLKTLGAETTKLPELIRLIDKKDKITLEQFAKELKDYLEPSSIIKLQKILENNQNSESKLKELAELNPADTELQKAIDECQKIVKIVNQPKTLQFDLSIARGLDYYTGLIFETKLKEHSNLGAICSGGRYDDLASQFSKQKLPGIGLSIGVSRLFDIALSKMAEQQKAKKLLIAFMGEYYLETTLKLAQQIREQSIITELFFAAKKINQQLSYALKNDFRWILFYGAEEQENAEVTLKDLSNKTQQKIKITDLKNYFKSL